MPAMVYPLILAAAFWVVVLILSAVDEHQEVARRTREAAVHDAINAHSAAAQNALAEAIRSTNNVQLAIQTALREFIESDAHARNSEKADAS